MKTTNNTILITGGSAGIGFALAQKFIAEGNTVIITGRKKERLDAAVKQLGGNVTGIAADVSDPTEVGSLVHRIKADFPELNVVINNAGAASAYRLGSDADAFTNAQQEILTNYLSVIRLNEKLLPLLKDQAEAAIVNVTSVVAFAPSIDIPTYSASKAALHSYSQSLRLTLEDTSVKVFELMPPLVNTEFSKDIGGENGIAPSVLADDLLAAFASDTFEIHTGVTADVYKLNQADPVAALHAMNSRG